MRSSHTARRCTEPASTSFGSGDGASTHAASTGGRLGRFCSCDKQASKRTMIFPLAACLLLFHEFRHLNLGGSRQLFPALAPGKPNINSRDAAADTQLSAARSPDATLAGSFQSRSEPCGSRQTRPCTRRQSPARAQWPCNQSKWPWRPNQSIEERC